MAAQSPLRPRGLQLAYDEAFDAVLNVHARRTRLDTEIVAMAAEAPFAAPVGRLECLRGQLHPMRSRAPGWGCGSNETPTGR